MLVSSCTGLPVKLARSRLHSLLCFLLEKLSRIGQIPLLLRGTIVNRTYGTHKNQYISLF